MSLRYIHLFSFFVSLSLFLSQKNAKSRSFLYNCVSKDPISLTHTLHQASRCWPHYCRTRREIICCKKRTPTFSTSMSVGRMGWRRSRKRWCGFRGGGWMFWLITRKGNGVDDDCCCCSAPLFFFVGRGWGHEEWMKTDCLCGSPEGFVRPAYFPDYIYLCDCGALMEIWQATP